MTLTETHCTTVTSGGCHRPSQAPLVSPSGGDVVRRTSSGTTATQFSNEHLSLLTQTRALFVCPKGLNWTFLSFMSEAVKLGLLALTSDWGLVLLIMRRSLIKRWLTWKVKKEGKKTPACSLILGGMSHWQLRWSVICRSGSHSRNPLF